jgi:hypothetical protein
MMLQKILENTTASPIELFYPGITLPVSPDYEIYHGEFPLWASDDVITEISPYVLAGDIVVKNGVEALEPVVGIVHLEVGVLGFEKDIPVYPGAGEFGGSLVEVSGAVDAIGLALNETMKSKVVLDGFVGTIVKLIVDLHTDNTVADRWAAFDLSSLASTGVDAKVMTTSNLQSEVGLVQAPTVANELFQTTLTIDSANFPNSEPFLSVGLKRVTTNTAGLGNKTDIASELMVTRITASYKRRMDI